MALRNKKTGEIGEPRIEYQKIYVDTKNHITHCYRTLRGMFNDWEDYEEPKWGYIIDPMDENGYSRDDDCFDEADRQKAKELGIWIETKEEAEKAVEKLKAWKRLKDKGLTFCAWKITDDGCSIDVETTLDAEIVRAQQKYITNDLDLLFGDEK